MAKTAPILIALAGFLALAPSPEAHRIQHPKRDALAFAPGHLTLSLTLDVEGGQEASALRERFDRNGDGLLDQEEIEALQAYLVTEAQRTLHLAINGKSLALVPTSVSAYGLGFPKASREHLGILVVLEGPVPTAPELSVSLADTTTEGMRQVPVEIRLSGFVAGGVGKGVISEAGGKILKSVLPKDGTPWTFTLVEEHPKNSPGPRRP